MSLTYKQAGVDIEAGQEFVDRVRGIATTTMLPGVLSQVGGFAGCMEIPTGYNQPVLVSGTDGVGTKLKLVQTPEHMIGIGIDLVAMVVNDILCCGAKPLFFLDYYATGHLDPKDASPLIAGIADACQECGMVLLGGETAEMPGVYKPGEFDLAGFGVGVVEKDYIINGPENVREGDVLIGIESSGPHSNGFSLIRNVITHYATPDPSMFSQIRRPTHIYSQVLDRIWANSIDVQGIAHITGGGLPENVPRILNDYLVAEVNPKAWMIPQVFKWIQEHGNVVGDEMFNVFNMGVGMVLAVRTENTNGVISSCHKEGYGAWVIGKVRTRCGTEPRLQFVSCQLTSP